MVIHPVLPALGLRLLPAATALLFVAAFPPFDLFPLAFVALVPLFLYLDAPGESRRARLGAVYAGGVLFHLIGFWWVRYSTAVGMVLMAFYTAGFWVVFAAVAAPRRRTGDAPGSSIRPLIAAAAWAAVEWLRVWLFGGIPWFLVGHSQIEFAPLAQVADLAGVPGVTFLVVLVNAALALGIVRWRSTRKLRPALRPPALALSLLVAGVAYGIGPLLDPRLPDAHLKETAWPEVLLVQGNIEQSVKQGARIRGWDEIFDVYARLTRDAMAAVPPGRSAENFSRTIVMWPETMFPPTPADQVRDPGGAALRVLPSIARCRWLIGIHLYERREGGDEWNGVVAADPEGRITGEYDKTHLVPVGEQLPFSGWSGWDWIYKTFTNMSTAPVLRPGGSRKPVLCGEDYKAPWGWKVGVLVCYESAFADISREEVLLGADFLANLSNEAWFEDSAEFEQMLAMARFRCIETRTGMARATNSGISCVIDPSGRVVAALRGPDGAWKQVAGTLHARVPCGNHDSLYLRWGDWFVLLCGLRVGVEWVLRWFRKKGK